MLRTHIANSWPQLIYDWVSSYFCFQVHQLFITYTTTIHKSTSKFSLLELSIEELIKQKLTYLHLNPSLHHRTPFHLYTAKENISIKSITPSYTLSKYCSSAIHNIFPSSYISLENKKAPIWGKQNIPDSPQLNPSVY